MSQYRTEKWRQFRQEMTELFEFRCSECEKPQEIGVCLQIHHRNGYDPRRPIWDYKPEEIEVLCKGCHARRHGKIIPRDRWVCVGENDLEDLIGTCERCGNDIRYEFFVEHDSWSPMTVGTNCCDNLTGEKVASERQRFMARMARFVSSPEWIIDRKVEIRTYKKLQIKIFKQEVGFKISINGIVGSKEFKNINLAKRLVFGIINDGQLERWLNSRNNDS